MSGEMTSPDDEDFGMHMLLDQFTLPCSEFSLIVPESCVFCYSSVEQIDRKANFTAEERM